MNTDLQQIARTLRQLADEILMWEQKQIASQVPLRKKQFNARKLAVALAEANEPLSAITELLNEKGANVTKRTVERWTKPTRDNTNGYK